MPSDQHSPLSRRQLQERAASGALWTLMHTALAVPIAFGVNVLLARVLGVADYGRLALLTTVIGIASTVVSSGVGSALTQFGSKAHAAGRFSEVRGLLSGNQGFRLFCSAPFLTLIVILVVDLSPPLMAVALIFGVWVPAFAAGAPASLTLENRTASAARLAILTNILIQATVVAVLLVAPSAETVWAARIVFLGLSALMALPLMRPDYRRASLVPTSPFRLPREFWRFALPVGAAGVVSTLALSRSETVLLEWLSTPTALGLYAMAFGLAGHIFAPAQALVNPLIPAISGLREVDVTAIGRAYTRTLRICGTICGFLLAAGAPALALLVPLIYGEAFSDADALVLSLAIVAGLTLVTYPMEAFVTARLKGASILRVNVLSLILGVLVALVLIPTVGVWGAVAAKLVIALTRLGTFLVLEGESFGVSTRESLLSLSGFFLAIVSSCASYSSAMLWFSDQRLTAALFAFTIGAGVYFFILWALRTGLSEGDRELLVSRFPNSFQPSCRFLFGLLSHGIG